ncbi:MAG: hypothetical protein ACYDB3_11285 [Acidimicrobiales bacterium]
MTRRSARRAPPLAAVAMLAGVALAGCANSDALGLVGQACAHVERSLAEYRAAGRSTVAANADAERAVALAELRLALPLAATAAGEAAQWQALMTTLAESSRVPESDLVDALQQQCSDVQTGNQPPSPSPATSPTTSPTTTVMNVPTLPEPLGR